MIHVALYKIVSLHAVLVRRQIGVLIEIRCPGLQFLQLPKICQALARVEADRPVIAFAINRGVQWLPLAGALHANIVPTNRIQRSGIYDIQLRGMRYMLAARPMALLAAYIPFRHSLGRDVVVHGVASIAGWSCGPVKVGRAVMRNPPVSSRLYVIRQPALL